MDNNIFYKLTPAALAAYFDALPPAERLSFFGESLFPSRYTPDLTLSFLRAQSPTPVALNLSSFDSKPPLRTPMGFEKVYLELPFFREAMILKEEEYSKLMRVQRKEMVEAYAAEIIDRLYDNNTELMNAGLYQKENMRMQLLGNAGKIKLVGAGSQVEYDYKMPIENQYTPAPGATWDNPTADIIGDLQRWRTDMWERTGVWPAIGVVSPKTWRYIMTNEAIVNGILLRFGTAAGSATTVNAGIPETEFGPYIRSLLGNGVAGSENFSFYVYPNAIKQSSRAPLTSLFPDDVVSMIPGGSLGYTYWSDTPEALRDSDSRPGQNFSVATIQEGIAICQVDSSEAPITLKTWAAMIAAPSFERIRECAIARVA